MTLDAKQLREICVLTLELVRLRQSECRHLSIENVAPEIFGKLLREAEASMPTHDDQPEEAKEPV